MSKQQDDELVCKSNKQPNMHNITETVVGTTPVLKKHATEGVNQDPR